MHFCKFTGGILIDNRSITSLMTSDAKFKLMLAMHAYSHCRCWLCWFASIENSQIVAITLVFYKPIFLLETKHSTSPKFQVLWWNIVLISWWMGISYHQPILACCSFAGLAWLVRCLDVSFFWKAKYIPECHSFWTIFMQCTTCYFTQISLSSK